MLSRIVGFYVLSLSLLILPRLLMAAGDPSCSAQAVLVDFDFPSGQPPVLCDADLQIVTAGAVGVAAGADVTFLAGRTIQLNPGFSVSAAGSFRAAIKSSPYRPPIGIPSPGFGIEQSHWDYQGGFYEAGGFAYRDAGFGPYTHYVDNTHPDCSNDQTYGTAQTPLCDPYPEGRSITLPAGSVMEIHGGPYTYSGWRRIIPQGTAEQPVYFRSVGMSDPVVIQSDSAQHDLRIEGGYLIVENLEFYNGSQPRIWDASHHIGLRHLEVHAPEDGFVIMGTALSAGTSTQDIVIYKNHIHHNRRIPADGDSEPRDLHGTGIGPGSQRIWILDNHIHHNSGDAFQACHLCNPAPEYVYVGRNEMHHDRENGVDLKTIRHVVVSENRIYGYQPSGTSAGDAVVIGSNGLDVGQGYGPDYAWFLFNDVTESHRGVRVEGVYNGWLIGNRIHGIETESIALDIKPPSETLRIINNTLSTADEGIHNHWLCGLSSLHVSNNIFHELAAAIDVQGCIADIGHLENNLFWNTDQDVVLYWGRDTYVGVLEQGINDLPNAAANLLADPRFVNAAANDYRITGLSPAIDSAQEDAAYATFQTLYGRDIAKDARGLSRPQFSHWDMGAYEYIESDDGG